MNESANLRVNPDSSIPAGEVQINPNEGIALNLFCYKHELTMFFGAKNADNFSSGTGGGEGAIEQPNECPLGVIKINPQDISSIGNAKQAKIMVEDNKALIMET